MKKGWLVFFAILFAGLFFFLSSGILSYLDNLVSSGVINFQIPFFNVFFIVLSQYVFDTKVLCIVVVLLFFVLYKKYSKEAVLLLGSVGVTAVISEGIKYLFKHSRPVLSLVNEISYGFPSSHASISLVFFAVLIFIFKDKIKSVFWKNFFIVASVFVVLLIGFSRVYLNAHYLSDVLAGYLLGGTVFVLSLLLIKLVMKQWNFIFSRKKF